MSLILFFYKSSNGDKDYNSYKSSNGNKSSIDNKKFYDSKSYTRGFGLYVIWACIFKNKISKNGLSSNVQFFIEKFRNGKKKG